MRSKARELLDILQTYYQHHSVLVNITVVVLVGFGIFSYGALWFTSTPSFCGNCHEILPTVESWNRSIHSGVTCTTCHPRPGIMQAIRRINMQFKEFHTAYPPEVLVRKKEQVHKACGECHSFNRKMAFSGGLNVPHKRHIKKGLYCTTCHTKVVHGEGGEKTRKPEMETCMKCHNGQLAPEACGICHLTLAQPTRDWR